MKHGEFTSQKKYKEPRKQSHKQQLASEYNFMLFRVTGTYCAPPTGRELPLDLVTAYFEFNKARNILIERLQHEDIRKEFMNINAELEKTNGTV